MLRKLLCLFAVLLVGFTIPAQAAVEARLQWDWEQGEPPNDAFPSEFRVKCGLASNTYSIITPIPGADTRTALIRNAINGAGRWYCTVSAANQAGESANANEVNFVMHTQVTGSYAVWTDGVNTWAGNPFCSEAGTLLSADSPAIDAGEVLPDSCPEPGLNPSGCREWYGKAPDIGACEYWSTIAPNTVAMLVRSGLVVGVSRRSTDTTSVISILVNRNEVIGPQGVEIVYPSGSILNVSRRSTDTTSVVSILVNKSTDVTVNGIAK